VTVETLTRENAFSRAAASLGVRAPASSVRTVMAQALRRASYVLAPTPRHDLEFGVAASFAGMLADNDVVDLVSGVLDSLLVYGDILEMRPAAGDQWDRSPLVLRPAPPSFVTRSDGSAIILGVAGEDLLGFAGDVADRLRFQDVLRVLPRQADVDLAGYLKENGLIELSEKAWLRIPQEEQARSYMAKWTEAVRAQADGSPSEILILDGKRSASFYKGRWARPDVQSGIYVGRRPQRYGSDIWCLCEIDRGQAIKFLDIFSVGDRLRPCDIAWRIQMAMDAAGGYAQKFRSHLTEDGYCLEFFSPLPSWAERRLCVAGNAAKRAGALLSYLIPKEAFEIETAFLSKLLWLQHEAR
jgi:hypothetical protein